MKIGINALFLRPGGNGGIETYLRELLKAMAISEDGGDLTYHVYLPEEGRHYPIPSDHRFRKEVVPISSTRQAQRYFYEQVQFPIRLARDDIDLVHSLAYVGPIVTSIPSVVTVHDLNFLAFGSLMPLVRRVVLGTCCYLTCNTARQVIAVSDFTRRAIVEELRISSEKIQRIYESAGTLVLEDSDQDYRRQNELPYLLTLGGRFPNKNVERLVMAFGEIRRKVNCQLLIVGSVASACQEALEKLDPSLRTHIKQVPHVTDGKLASIFRGARAYVHPSLYEGFGMPLLEAQAAGTVVVSSNAGSLMEVGGDGALYFNPTDSAEMIAQVLRGMTNEQLRAQLQRNATRNLERFSWNVAAKETIALYHNTLRGGDAV